MRLVVTGTPGTGKTFLAKKLAEQEGAEYIDVKKIIGQHKLYLDDEGTVDIRKLQRVLRPMMRSGNVIVESHLLCEFSLPCERCIVLRCDPLVLEKRLGERRYSKQKTLDNLLCEALDYCLVNAERHYRHVTQVDCTKMPSAKRLLDEKSDSIDWRDALKTLAKRQTRV
ncbi:Putative adenylate kinase [Candidatus Norongarragalina meridionalis]|nr:Putative adenylate kinase [Candidatus Norongarragalina meridionalis]